VIHVIWMADSSVLWPHSSSNQTLALKKQIRFFSESFRVLPDSFISKNEGMAKGTRAKTGRLEHWRGYTITALVEEPVERVERRVTASLPSRALKPIAMPDDRLRYNHRNTTSCVMALSNTEKQARYRERHLALYEKVDSGDPNLSIHGIGSSVNS
jgi:hypothetical protein